MRSLNEHKEEIKTYSKNKPILGVKDPNDIYRYGIYRIYDKKNDKSYVGKSVQSIKRRFNKHFSMLRGGYHSNKLLQQAFSDGNEEDFDFEILHICTHPDEITKYERLYIDKYDSMWTANGYNLELPQKDIELDQGTDKENKKEDLPNLNMANRRKEKGKATKK
jgi:group I intron endonuclease